MQWCDSALIKSPYHYGVCVSEKDFHAALRKLKVPSHLWMPFVIQGKDATVHYWTHHDGRNIAIVCIDDSQKRPRTEIIGLLIHEAVHIWQAILDEMGESTPSREFEAYSIQWISQELIESYKHARLKKRGKS